MNKTIILGLAIAAFFPLTGVAASNDKYPAADFQPSVIYIDKDLAGEVEEATKPDPKYPAASFQPKVVYIDQELAGQAQQQTQQEEVDHADPKYPAAYFKPKVIYP